jgi:hypothetical protein
MCKWERNVSTHNSYDLVCVGPLFDVADPLFLPCTSCVKWNEIQHHFLSSPLQMSVPNNRRVLARSRKGRAIKYLHTARNKKERGGGKIDPNRNIEIKLLCLEINGQCIFFFTRRTPPDAKMGRWPPFTLPPRARNKKIILTGISVQTSLLCSSYVIVFLQSITAWWSSFSKDDCHYFKFRGSFSNVWHLSFKHLRCTRRIEIRSSIESYTGAPDLYRSYWPMSLET